MTFILTMVVEEFGDIAVETHTRNTELECDAVQYDRLTSLDESGGRFINADVKRVRTRVRPRLAFN